MTTEYRLNSQPEITYFLKPGIIYIYRKQLAITREFDLSGNGLYHFSTQLRGTPLRTAHLQ